MTANLPNHNITGVQNTVFSGAVWQSSASTSSLNTQVATKTYVDDAIKHLEDCKMSFVFSVMFSLHPEESFDKAVAGEIKEKGYIKKLGLREFFTDDQKRIYDTMQELTS